MVEKNYDNSAKSPKTLTFKGLLPVSQTRVRISDTTIIKTSQQKVLRPKYTYLCTCMRGTAYSAHEVNFVIRIVCAYCTGTPGFL